MATDEERKLKTISDLDDGGDVQYGDIVPILRSGLNYYASIPPLIAYGQIYFADTSTLDTTLTLADTYYPLVTTASETLIEGVTRNMTTDVSVGNGSLIIDSDYSGDYYCNYSISYYTSSNNVTITASIFVNGVCNNQVCSKKKVVTGSTILATASSGFFNLSGGDVVDIRFKSDIAAEVLSASHVSLVLEKL